MRKLKLQVQMTIDGFIAGQNGEMDWMCFPWTDDIKKYVDQLTQNLDTILLGKNLATGFIPHWAAVAKDNNNPEKEAGVKYSETHKVVFSKTLTKSEWENTEVENGDFVKKIKILKNQSGNDIIVYGGAKFVSSLIKENLIDEYYLFINPIAIGNGLPIFKELNQNLQLELTECKNFDCGIALTKYILKK